MVKAIFISISKLAVFKYKGFRLARNVFIYTNFEKCMSQYFINSAARLKGLFQRVIARMFLICLVLNGRKWFFLRHLAFYEAGC
ncbi:hypothetical protein BKM01_02085 [Methanohalophilus portucalensis]|uniref:Uncharacterized protein n=1 Tax=Methanohalophilus portucalensis TaxID=39664 RepID=A0A2D3C4M2_9EURY|nr:hypothetical protein BKM01_02085 [Methanohalophilus portucalensis]